MSFITGYKGFNYTTDGKLRCRDMIYEIEKTNTIDTIPVIGESGLHYCEKFNDVLSYYPIDKPGIRYGLVHDVGTMRVKSYDKNVTNALKVCQMLNGTIICGPTTYTFKDGMLVLVVSTTGLKWWVDGKLHRVDGPAVENSDGKREWWVNDKLHRVDGPAVEWVDGSREWYVNGERHRIDGPAIEWKNGYREWWVDGKRHRVDGPAIEDTDGSRAWYIDGKRHRIDGPAIERVNGTREWWVDGKLHRDDGPAIENADGTREWWNYGIRVGWAGC